MKTISLNQVVVLALMVTSPLQAGTRTWTGGAIGNNQWINITNWGLTLPANGQNEGKNAFTAAGKQCRIWLAGITA